MKTKNIFNLLALAMLMPAMMLTTACSEDDNAVIDNENANQKGLTLPVTVNVTRQGDDATTRATYNESTHKLEFSSGDKLFVMGEHATAGQFAGTLTMVSEGTFSGTITVENTSYSGDADALLSGATVAGALLLPEGYDTSYEYIRIEGTGYSAEPHITRNKAFATTKAAAVEQFSFEMADSYSSGTGFELSPYNAILNFTITGLTANKNVEVYTGNPTILASVTTDASGTASFAIGVDDGTKLQNLALRMDGNTYITLPSKTLEAGHVYNILKKVGTEPSLIDAFENDKTTVIAFTVSSPLGNADLTLSAKYSGGLFVDFEKTGTAAALITDASMARSGNNLVITITVFNSMTSESKTGSMTIDTANNTYWWSNAEVGGMITLESITIGGNDIDPLPTVTPAP